MHYAGIGLQPDVLMTTLLRLCEHFAVTPDYLLGVVRDPHDAHDLYLVCGAAEIERCAICHTPLGPHEPHTTRQQHAAGRLLWPVRHVHQTRSGG